MSSYLLAGTGVATAEGGRSSTTSPGVAAFQANRHAAEREVSHLMALVRLPKGASRLAGVPKSSPLAGNWYITEGTQLDETRYWAVPITPQDPLAWVKAHPPAGLKLTGEGSGSGPLTMLTYGAPATAVWVQAELDLTEASETGIVRADAVVVWLDPRPLPDSAAGPRVRVEVRRGCPANTLHSVGVTNAGAIFATQLLPPGPPGAGLVCVYNYGRLTHRLRLAGAAAQRWAAAVKALPLSHTDGTGSNCGTSSTKAVLALSYTGRADADIWIDLTACGVASNGHLVADRLFGSSLERLVVSRG